MDKNSEIPIGWVVQDLGNITYLNMGQSPPSSTYNNEGIGLPFFQGKTEFQELYPYINKFCSDPLKIVDKDDILISVRAPVGPTNLAPEKSSIGRGLAGIKSFSGMHSKFLLFQLRSIENKISDLGTGTTFKAISSSNLASISIFLPPLNEQQRIVSKIEELFSDLDNGMANLKLAQNQLKVYRQALLKHAFEGKLTEQWRKENKPEPAEKLLERIKEERKKRYEQELKDWKAAVKAWEKDGKKEQRPSRPSKPIVPEKPNDFHESKKWELPKGWDWSQLGLVTFITKLAGFEYTKYVSYDEDGDLSVIKAENAGPNGFKRTDYSRIKSETVSNLKRSRLSGGELLVVFVGAGTGNVAVVPKYSNYFLGPNIGMARPYGNIDSKYLEFFYQSPMGKDILMVTVKAVAQPSLSMGTIRQTPLVIPSIEEQNLIIQILDAQFSVVENLERTIESGLQKSEALRQSILKKAFEGKLVPQDPNDEPASELLNRIEAEKKKHLEQQKQQKKRKPKNTKKMSKELSIEEVLKTSDKPMLAKDVWQKSKHKENIEDFYMELKDIQSKIKEVKKGTESLLSLV
ncbi:restriction endonuclease subunit S [Imperialibacter roseus]|uniref:Restriction endonuclease subunit S n=1 Tax=Imperialibacter roseus TaxID=1324217 RepID=A0ABZ0IXT2_9BACT|nr:restriction endonuclease subunit S [Imperialibacter roseus]WOK09204.1 restriction endonuclease subunit S [Imperialibacter roseus]